MLTILQHYDYQLLIDYYHNNRAHLAAWEPEREPDYFCKYRVRRRLMESNELFSVGAAVHFVAFTVDEQARDVKAKDVKTRDDNDVNYNEIIGVCNFTNIIRGSFQACSLGYSIAEAHQGKGLMKEILTAGIDYMFTEQNLHRIMANYIPSNTRSGALLSSLGFEQEGVAKSYLKIAGRWQDHCLTSKINSEYLDKGL
ncbi:GNAT family N-acetyltransferase [Shewanella atlantica]|uniref:GNAT family N-acetyltransferase n=1 Tax=Shewanella atlantica TaxID=271099 RepID=UPI003735ACA8